MGAPVRIKRTLLFHATAALLLLLPCLVLAEQQTGEGKIYRRPLPFVSFLEKSLLKIPAARDITVGDFNGDGLADLFFHTADPGVFHTSLGDGKGNFTLPKKHGFGAGYAGRFAGTTFVTGDYDGDGKDEFISLQWRQTGSETTQTGLFLVSSNLTDEDTLVENRIISLPGTLAAHDSRFSLFGADINGDIRKDFVLGDEFSRKFFVIQNSPGLWTPSSNSPARLSVTTIDTHTAQTDNGKPFHVLLLDADNDGTTDILKIGEKRILLFHGDGKESFTASNDLMTPGLVLAQSTGMSFGANPGIFHGHLDRDEFLDLFITNDAGQCWILKNTAGIGFSFFTGLAYYESPYIRIGDFNGDGLDDLVAWGRGYKGIKILLNGGDGGFRAIERSLRGKSALSLAVNDINGDGLSDIILAVTGAFGGLEGRVLLNISQKPAN